MKEGQIRNHIIALLRAFSFAGVLLGFTILLNHPAFAGETALSRSKVSLQIHNAFVLKLKNPQRMAVKWKCSNRKVLSVVYSDITRIVVRAEKPGSARIICSIGEEKKVCRFTVRDVKGIPKKMTVIEGDQVKFRHSSQAGWWSSSDENIAKITGRKKIRSKIVRFTDVGKVVISEKIWRKKYRCQVTVLTKDGYKTRQAAEQAGKSTRVWQFILNLFEIAQTVDADIAAGVPWAYYNTSSHRSASTFEATREQGRPWTNCQGGVAFGLQLHGLVGYEGTRWYGTKGSIHWNDAQAEIDAHRYFDIIPVWKSVQDGIADNTIHPGDILFYRSIVHVNVYLGNMYSFDTGHAFCSGSGEGARYQRWIGPTPYLTRTVSYVMRLKEVVDPPAAQQAQGN